MEKKIALVLFFIITVILSDQQLLAQGSNKLSLTATAFDFGTLRQSNEFEVDENGEILAKFKEPKTIGKLRINVGVNEKFYDGIFFNFVESDKSSMLGTVYDCGNYKYIKILDEKPYPYFEDLTSIPLRNLNEAIEAFLEHPSSDNLWYLWYYYLAEGNSDYKK